MFEEVDPEWEFSLDVVFEFGETGEGLADEVEKLFEGGGEFGFLWFGGGGFEYEVGEQVGCGVLLGMFVFLFLLLGGVVEGVELFA
jgi:hypothetical protein